MADIAITGLGCLFPGASSPEAYWDNLSALKDCTTPLSEAELGVDPAVYFHPVKGTPDKINYTRNGHVRGFEFDPELKNLHRWHEAFLKRPSATWNPDPDAA